MRRVLAVAMVIASLAACTSAAPPDRQASPTVESANATAAATQDAVVAPSGTPRQDPKSQPRDTSIARIGQLADPLPAPLSLDRDTTDAAKALARATRRGDETSLPALLAALKASGIAVVGPNDELLLRPDAPFQGQILRSWEVRLLLASVLPERTVTMSLPEFADAVRAVPELNSPEIEKLIVDDLRRLARATPSPKQFWARFIIELGRDATAIDENDLATASDLSQLRLNGLQTSLILRRLSLDLLMLGSRGTRSGVPHVAMSILGSSASAEQPCQMTDTQKTILEIASFATKAAVDGFKVFDLGFEGLFGYLENLGLASAGTSAVGKFRDVTGIAGGLLAYAEFIATYAALEVKVEMESAPLTRTKQVRPASGEKKDLTAVVRLNTGSAQIINCFRIMLNTLGLDFKVAQDGPVKAARVAWQGDSGFSELVAQRGGPDQIVRFAGSGSDGEFKSENSITNAATNADGKTTVKVEGVGQRVKKSENAVKVVRHASVHVDVALQGADLFGDLQDAANSAVGGVKALITLPLDMLKRSKWASEGHYTFDVIDWSGTQWSGNVSMTKTEVTRRVVGDRTSDSTIVTESKVQITKATKYEIQGDDQTAEMTGTIDGGYQQATTVTQNWTVLSDSRICVGQTFSGTDLEKDSANGSGSGEATITVNANDTDYAIFAVPADDAPRMRVTGEHLLQGHKFRQAGNGCQNVVVDTTTDTRPIDRTEPLMGIEVKGHMDPDDVTHLSGSTTTKQDVGGTTITITIRWDLRQD